jgi:predicted transposase/invertase (TIGR01784 family)
MPSGIAPTVDYVFKRIFGSEEFTLLLIDLLNAVLLLAAGKVVKGVGLLNPFTEKGYAEAKVSILDVRARDDPGRQFLLEMQQYLTWAFAKRLLYYWACGHSEQIMEGEQFEMLHPTYMICFLTEALFDDAAYHHRFRVFDQDRGVELCQDLEIHTIELGKFALSVEDVKTPLERWCYFLKHGASLDLETLPATLDVRVIRKAVEVLMQLSQNELERQRFLERQRAQRDAASLAADARTARETAEVARKAAEASREAAEASREAAEVARQAAEVARRKGPVVGRIGLLQQLLQQPETPVEELYRLPDEQLSQLEQSLRQQLSGKKDANGTAPADKT